MPQDPQPPNGQADDTSLLTWLGFRDPFEFGTARPLGALLGCLLTLIVPLLFFGALCAAGAVLWHSIHLALFGSTEGLNLGAGALIAALLGAPFVIWGTVLKHQSLRYQKEGHITDRISKAVEQLGAEKKVDRIGRPVTIWFDALPSFWRSSEHSENYLNKPRTKLSRPEWNEFWDPETNEHKEGQYVSVTSYQQERTVIQWQGDPVQLADGEVIGSEGEWKVFSESLPNIEVRIGAILSLERIAQDSTKHDKGRDHVRVMEILCAYIRENAPAKGAEPGPYDAADPLTALRQKTETDAFQWQLTLEGPRADIQIAVTVLARRSTQQIQIEGNFKGADGRAYTLDLNHTNLRRADLRGGNFASASFQGARLEGADLEGANLSGSNLMRTRFTWAKALKAVFDNADLALADLSYAGCEFSKFRNCRLYETHFVHSRLIRAELSFQAATHGGLYQHARFLESALHFVRISGSTEGLSVTMPKIDGGPDVDPPRGLCFQNCILGGPLWNGAKQIWRSFPSAYLPLTFGDASVTLADEAERPAHWPRWVLPDTGPHSYEAEYQRWLADPQGYTPPPPPG